MSISKSVSNSLILLFACIGCFVTLVLFYEHLKPNANIGCSAVGGNCEAANESSYGHVGKIPTSVFGLAMYVTLVGICLKRRKLMAANLDTEADDSLELTPDDDADVGVSSAVIYSPLRRKYPRLNTPERKQLRAFDLLVFVIASSAVVISWWLQHVALYVLVSFCPWCMSSAFLVTFIFLLASKDLFLDDQPLAGEPKLLVGTVTFIAAMGFLMMLPDIMHQIQMAQGKEKANFNGPRVVKATDPPIKTSDMEVTGPADAPFTIVEFADYQCPHCQKASIMISNELKKSPKRFRFAFRNDPLPMHKWANQAASAAEAAGEQGKFWQMHDYIFAHQSEMSKPTFSPDVFTKYAAELGLDSARFERDANSDKIMTRVANDATTAIRVSVQMTPTFFVFDRKGKLYQFTGMEKMQLALEDPDHEAWK